MSTLLETLKQSKAYRSRSEQLLRRAADGQPRELPGLYLSELLNCVAAALVLEQNRLAQDFLQRFIAEGRLVEKDTRGFEAELDDAQAVHPELSHPYSHLLANVLNLELALGCRDRLEKRPRLSEWAEHVVDADGCLGHESYLIELALGRRQEAEALRAERWDRWIDEEVVCEGDRGWELAVALGQGRERDFQRLFVDYVEQKRLGVSAHGPYGHHFAPTVLELEGMAILTTAQRCQLPFPSELLSHFGLRAVIQDGLTACR